MRTHLRMEIAGEFADRHPSVSPGAGSWRNTSARSPPRSPFAADLGDRRRVVVAVDPQPLAPALG